MARNALAPCEFLHIFRFRQLNLLKNPINHLKIAYLGDTLPLTAVILLNARLYRVAN